VRVNILVGSEELASALRRILKYVFGVPEENLNVLFLGNPLVLSRELLEADLWIVEAFHPLEPNNPEGFRTAYKLASTASFLLLFTLPYLKDFPSEGPFWWTLSSHTNLARKIEDALSHIPKREDFEALIKKWPELIRDPTKHHHGHDLNRGGKR